MTFNKGDRIGHKYVVHKKIGAGSFGIIYHGKLLSILIL